MGKITVGGIEYETVEGTVPPMTKEQSAEYGRQVGGFYKEERPVKDELPVKNAPPKTNPRK
ncbi:MAG: hypothetical protein ACI4RG_02395 [Huintestinicola sp.]